MMKAFRGCRQLVALTVAYTLPNGLVSVWR
jgi:hypothetical protein